MKRTPFLAIESMFGVGMSLQPWKPVSPQPRSSAKKMTRLGLSAAAWVVLESSARTAGEQAGNVSRRETRRLECMGSAGFGGAEPANTRLLVVGKREIERGGFAR